MSACMDACHADDKLDTSAAEFGTCAKLRPWSWLSSIIRDVAAIWRVVWA